LSKKLLIWINSRWPLWQTYTSIGFCFCHFCVVVFTKRSGYMIEYYCFNFYFRDSIKNVKNLPKNLVLLYIINSEYCNNICFYNAVFSLILITYLLVRKPNIEIFFIYSNKFFHNFHLSESSFTCFNVKNLPKNHWTVKYTVWSFGCFVVVFS
jgi:hypothetical protein